MLVSKLDSSEHVLKPRDPGNPVETEIPEHVRD